MFRAPALALVAALSAAPALAAPVAIVGGGAGSTEGIGFFTGTVDYTPTSATSGTLHLTIKNTAQTLAGGKITGVVLLNDDEWSNITVQLAATPVISHVGFINTGTESASPFGGFQGGAALGGSWLGGGSPNGGVARGQTLDATFNISGAGAGAMTSASFVQRVSGDYQLVVRYRGFDCGGSDKVPACLVPTPGAAALIGLGSLFAGRRRR